MLRLIIKSLFKILFFLKFDSVVYRIIINSGKRFKKSNSNKKCIVINRSIFQEDMKVIDFNNNNVDFLYIHKMFFQAIYECFFDKFSTREKDYYTRAKPSEKKRLSEKYSNFIDFLNCKGFNIFISGNFNYVELYEFFKVCNIKKNKILIMYKEGFGVKSKILEAYFKEYNNFDFNIDLITFSNKIIKDAAIKNINFVNEDNSKIIGIPRIERYNRESKITGISVLFSAYPIDKIRLVSKKYFEDSEIDNIFIKLELMHYFYLKYALDNQKSKFIIKTKKHKKYFDYVDNIKRKYFRNVKFNNLSIISHDFDGNLFEKVDTAVSWGSTTILEAIYCNKKILVPKISPKIDKEFNLIYKNTDEKNKIKNYYEFESYNEFKDAMESMICLNYISNNKTLESNIPNFKEKFNYSLGNFF